MHTSQENWFQLFPLIQTKSKCGNMSSESSSSRRIAMPSSRRLKRDVVVDTSEHLQKLTDDRDNSTQVKVRKLIEEGKITSTKDIARGAEENAELNALYDNYVNSFNKYQFNRSGYRGECYEWGLLVTNNSSKAREFIQSLLNSLKKIQFLYADIPRLETIYFALTLASEELLDGQETFLLNAIDAMTEYFGKNFRPSKENIPLHSICFKLLSQILVVLAVEGSKLFKQFSKNSDNLKSLIKSLPDGDMMVYKYHKIMLKNLIIAVTEPMSRLEKGGRIALASVLLGLYLYKAEFKYTDSFENFEVKSTVSTGNMKSAFGAMKSVFKMSTSKSKPDKWFPSCLDLTLRKCKYLLHPNNKADFVIDVDKHIRKAKDADIMLNYFVFKQIKEVLESEEVGVKHKSLLYEKLRMLSVVFKDKDVEACISSYQTKDGIVFPLSEASSKVFRYVLEENGFKLPLGYRTVSLALKKTYADLYKEMLNPFVLSNNQNIPFEKADFCLREDKLDIYMKQAAGELAEMGHIPLMVRRRKMALERLDFSEFSLLLFTRRGGKFNVHATAGMGKTGLCSKIIHAWCSSEGSEQWETIYLLKGSSLNSKGHITADFIASSIFDKYHDILPPEDSKGFKLAIELQLQRPSTLLILDGMEDCQPFNDVLESMKDQGVTLLTTCRTGTAFNVYADRHLSCFTLLPLSVEQVLGLCKYVLRNTNEETSYGKFLNFIESQVHVRNIFNVPVYTWIVLSLWRDKNGYYGKESRLSLWKIYKDIMNCFTKFRKKSTSSLTADVHAYMDGLPLLTLLGFEDQDTRIITSGTFHAVARKKNYVTNETNSQNVGFLAVFPDSEGTANYLFPHFSFQEHCLGTALSAEARPGAVKFDKNIAKLRKHPWYTFENVFKHAMGHVIGGVIHENVESLIPAFFDSLFRNKATDITLSVPHLVVAFGCISLYRIIASDKQLIHLDKDCRLGERLEAFVDLALNHEEFHELIMKNVQNLAIPFKLFGSLKLCQDTLVERTVSQKTSEDAAPSFLRCVRAAEILSALYRQSLGSRKSYMKFLTERFLPEFNNHPKQVAGTLPILCSAYSDHLSKDEGWKHVYSFLDRMYEEAGENQFVFLKCLAVMSGSDMRKTLKVLERIKKSKNFSDEYVIAALEIIVQHVKSKDIVALVEPILNTPAGRVALVSMINSSDLWTAEDYEPMIAEANIETLLYLLRDCPGKISDVASQSVNFRFPSEHGLIPIGNTGGACVIALRQGNCRDQVEVWKNFFNVLVCLRDTKLYRKSVVSVFKELTNQPKYDMFSGYLGHAIRELVVEELKVPTELWEMVHDLRRNKRAEFKDVLLGLKASGLNAKHRRVVADDYQAFVDVTREDNELYGTLIIETFIELLQGNTKQGNKFVTKLLKSNNQAGKKLLVEKVKTVLTFVKDPVWFLGRLMDEKLIDDAASYAAFNTLQLVEAFKTRTKQLDNKLNELLVLRLLMEMVEECNESGLLGVKDIVGVKFYGSGGVIQVDLNATQLEWFRGLYRMPTFTKIASKPKS